MAIKPILFNTEMVLAILEGRKTQTRRIIKLAPGFTGRQVGESGNPNNPLGFMYPCGIKRPPCNKGDILWVRETWSEMPYGFVYCADDLLPVGWDHEDRWHPSIHMPKQAARIFLCVKDVRVEKLNNILAHAGEVAKEGIPYRDEGDIEASGLRFKELWDSTIKPADRDCYGWDANPWVWVIEFERCEKPEGWCV